MKSKLFKLTITFVVAVFIMAIGFMPSVNASDKINAPVYDEERDYAEWDCIYFGNYPQNGKNAEDVQPIKWRVLSVDGNDVMLMSDKCLIASEYIFDISGTSWDGSQLKTLLNTTFKSMAFTAEELNSIISVTVKNEANPEYPENSYTDDSKESIYVLSYAEACNPEYGFCTDPAKASKTRMAALTTYANSLGNVDSSWWLRTLGKSRGLAACVSDTGKINGEGRYILNDQPDKVKKYLAVRPVLHLDISNENVWSNAGKVTSEDELEQPAQLPEGTEEPKATDRPAATDKPDTTDRPNITEKPQATEEPGNKSNVNIDSSGIIKISEETDVRNDLPQNKAGNNKKTKKIELKFKKGKTYKLPLKNRKKYIYKAGNKKVLKVNKKGVIKIIKKGRCKVTAKRGSKIYIFKLKIG